MLRKKKNLLFLDDKSFQKLNTFRKEKNNNEETTHTYRRNKKKR